MKRKYIAKPGHVVTAGRSIHCDVDYKQQIDIVDQYPWDSTGMAPEDMQEDMDVRGYWYYPSVHAAFKDLYENANSMEEAMEMIKYSNVPVLRVQLGHDTRRWAREFRRWMKLNDLTF